MSKCIATINDTPEVESSDPRTQTGFDGKPCATTTGVDRVTHHTLEVAWSQISMDGFSIMNPSYRITRDDKGEAIGMFASNTIDPSSGYAIEVWASPMGDGGNACTGETDAEGAWYYRVYPWVSGATPGDLTMGGSDEVSFSMTGKTKSNARWGKGPYDITLHNGAPSGLPDAFDPDGDEPYWEGTVFLPPPEPDCDCIDVERPIPEPATLIITGNAEESPRCAVNVFADNNGLGPVVVDWGDGTTQETPEMTTVTHRYANCSGDSYSAGDTVIRVMDKQDPAVVAEKRIQLPLPKDEPDLAVTGAGTPDAPNRVTAMVVLPPQSGGEVIIDWGDRTTTTAAAGESMIVEAQHVYKYPNRYRITVARAERPRLKSKLVVSVPIDGYGGS
ncbi:hypothetical protein ABT282_30945 [Streptomyces sp. NPDC000927]|uniref:hypothetical protein n=1 Tax=Streptomyces sp. NPDC000927 TaxID=3154371 RepID=UPI00332EDCE6